MSWYLQHPERWEIEQKLAAGILNQFQSEIGDSGKPTITGEISVFIGEGQSYGPFHIAIVYPSRFPTEISAPNIYLLNNPYGWENVEDSHIEKDWRLCLGVPSELGINFKDEASLVMLLEKVSAFFLLQRIYQKDLFRERLGGAKARWPGNDRKHGLLGISQAVRGWKASRDGNRLCPCGEGAKFKKCCAPKLASRGLL